MNHGGCWTSSISRCPPPRAAAHRGRRHPVAQVVEAVEAVWCDQLYVDEIAALGLEALEGRGLYPETALARAHRDLPHPGSAARSFEANAHQG